MPKNTLPKHSICYPSVTAWADLTRNDNDINLKFLPSDDFAFNTPPSSSLIHSVKISQFRFSKVDFAAGPSKRSRKFSRLLFNLVGTESFPSDSARPT
ncbi:hypothetical protein TNCV_4247541 [Trichonephila clavipes]|nr:hypothetical protein TNCV_4247541 [Trichonephila clavipes]